MITIPSTSKEVVAQFSPSRSYFPRTARHTENPIGVWNIIRYRTYNGLVIVLSRGAPCGAYAAGMTLTLQRIIM